MELSQKYKTLSRIRQSLEKHRKLVKQYFSAEQPEKSDKNTK